MRLDESFLHDLSGIAHVREGEPLARHTTFGIGGPADAYVVVDSSSSLAEVARLCRAAEVTFFVLGSGSNIVVGDEGMRGVTIENNAQKQTEPRLVRNGADHYLVRADAGCSFAATARHLAFAGFAGLEWACGIPGTIGGAVVYNAGAYGGCLGDVLQRIAIGDAEGETTIEAADLGLVYRGSAFTRGLMAGKAVLWAEFELWPGDASQLRQRVAEYDQRRLKAQPRGRNAGSIFKNPPEHPAWRLIDEVGLRGHRIGDAEFSPQHCNFIVNVGHAQAADVAGLIREAQRRVREQSGLDLQTEVSLVGEGFGDE